MKTILVFLCLTGTCFAGTKTTTYYNRNGSIQFRATESRSGTVTTRDSRGCFSGSYQRSGNSVRQTNSGFSQARPNSSFIRRK